MLCKLRHTSVFLSSLYACMLSSCFVMNLYLLIPKQVTSLPRSDERQIQWRIFSVVVTSMVAIATFPYIFCENLVAFEGIGVDTIKNILGWRSIDKTTFVPLLHAAILYFGSFVTSIIRYRLNFIGKRYSKAHLPDKNFFAFMTRHIVQNNMQRFSNRWQASRDYFFAPLVEEIIFRTCIIPPFLFSGNMSMMAVCWITPLFFGLAHVHHAITKLKNGAPIKTVLFSTIFQLVYTTLFGAYASYCYIKIGSLPAIVILHSFCNFMGLPDVSLLFGFVQGSGDAESLQRSRILSGIAYIAGIASFWVCFGLFPYEELLLVTT